MLVKVLPNFISGHSVPYGYFITVPGIIMRSFLLNDWREHFSGVIIDKSFLRIFLFKVFFFSNNRVTTVSKEGFRIISITIRVDITLLSLFV